MTDKTASGGPSPETMRAIAALEVAAAAGNPDAQLRLGVMYANGDEVPLNYSRAAELIGQAAEQGLVDAQSTLAWLYANGYGVAQSDDGAREWYTRAAEQGSARDQYVVGTMYRFAQFGAGRDGAAASRWFRLSADQGFAPAQFALGKMLMEGKVVPEDRVAAFQWLSLAHVNGSKRAEGAVKELLRRMTPAEVLRAKAEMLGAAGHQLGGDD
jgi:TPR repeat protein